jgi:hypothetical protein
MLPGCGASYTLKPAAPLIAAFSSCNSTMWIVTLLQLVPGGAVARWRRGGALGGGPGDQDDV